MVPFLTKKDGEERVLRERKFGFGLGSYKSALDSPIYHYSYWFGINFYFIFTTLIAFKTLSQDIFLVFLKTNSKNAHDIQQALIGTAVNLCEVIDSIIPYIS